MAIEFNKYNNYNFAIGQQTAKVAKGIKKAEENEQIAKSGNEYRGLENETDLLTKNTQYLYGVKIGNFTAEDKEIADTTNAILAQLGYNRKVSAAQVASVANNVKSVVAPGMKSVADAAVAANIQDPNGPFAQLFT